MNITLRPSVTITKEQYERLQLAAKADDRTVSNLIRWLVIVFLREKSQ